MGVPVMEGTAAFEQLLREGVTWCSLEARGLKSQARALKWNKSSWGEALVEVTALASASQAAGSRTTHSSKNDDKRRVALAVTGSVAAVKTPDIVEGLLQ